MTEKILDYRTVSSPVRARMAVEYFEKKYHCDYYWGLSHGEIEEAVAVCLLETEHGYRCIITTKGMNYINNRITVKAIDIGEL